MFHPKKPVAIVALSILMMTPFAPSLYLIGPDTAYAEKGGNGGGKGGGNGGGKSGDSAGQGRSAETARSDESGKGAKASGLGNMNAAMNANINAVLAHIRNGNTNGPVGRVAALVAADATVLAATEDLTALQQIEQQWVAYDQSLEAAAVAAGFANYAAYDQVASAEGFVPTQEMITAFEGITEPLTARPDPQVLVEAETAATDAAAAVTTAEADLLDGWNKTTESVDLLTLIRDRFANDLDAIASAL